QASDLYLFDPNSSEIVVLDPGTANAQFPLAPGAGGLTSATFLALGDRGDVSHFKYEVVASNLGVTGYVDDFGNLRVNVVTGIFAEPGSGPVDMGVRDDGAADGHRRQYAEYAFTGYGQTTATHVILFNDRDQDGLRDGDEEGLAGVLI